MDPPVGVANIHGPGNSSSLGPAPWACTWLIQPPNLECRRLLEQLGPLVLQSAGYDYCRSAKVAETVFDQRFQYRVL